VIADLYVGSPGKKAANLCGLGTTLQYKNSWMVPGSFSFNANCLFPCGNSPTIQLLHREGTRIQYSIVRLNKRDTAGYGAVAEIKFGLKHTQNANYSANGQKLPFNNSRT
jgi:hypothetical protein